MKALALTSRLPAALVTLTLAGCVAASYDATRADGTHVHESQRGLFLSVSGYRSGETNGARWTAFEQLTGDAQSIKAAGDVAAQLMTQAMKASAVAP